MSRSDVTFEGLEDLERAIEPRRFANRLEREVYKASRLNAQIGASAITTSINSGGYAPNSPTTTAIKGSGRPLVDKGHLLQSITGETEGPYAALVGVLKSRVVTDESGKGKDILNIAKILHEGAVIPVTDKMRRFMAMMSRKNPGRYRPIRNSTSVIVIPRRPFLEAALTDAMQKKYNDNWMRAVHRSFNGRR